VAGTRRFLWLVWAYILTSVTNAQEPTMQSHPGHPAIVLSRPYPLRAALAIGDCWRALAGALGSLWRASLVRNRDSIEREALAGLDAHMLKDIGASHWLVADAAIRARDDFRGRVEGGLY
jgi:hypothetical protein